MRSYESSHPWITFRFDLDRLSHRAWRLLGEAESKCEHLAGVPLRPEVARRLHQIYLTKGVHGTTSIEGNTLSEAEVLARVAGDLPLPPSRAYLGTEIDNVVAACNRIVAEVVSGENFRVSVEQLRQFNKDILSGLPLGDDVHPGELRTHSVVVFNYRGAPAEDCSYLLDRLSKWLERDFVDPTATGEYRYCLAIIKAILAHLYLAWIHPFGDGNGRTARLLEFKLLVAAGLPIPAAHLLSDHYNRTRDRYYQVLARTSRGKFPAEEFVEYALQGLVDELREQIDEVRRQQLQVTWENFIHDVFRDKDTAAKRRQKYLMLDLPDALCPIAKIREVSTRVAVAYAGKQQKTITRDLNELAKMELIRRTRREVRPRREIIQAFLPVRATPQEV